MPTVSLTRTPDKLYPGAPYAYAASPAPGTRLVFLAGACPLDVAGAVTPPDHVAGQAEQAMSTLEAALAAAGGRLGDVVFLRVLVATADRGELVAAWDAVHDRFAAAGHEPPGTLQGVTVLGYEGQLVEVEAVAAVEGGA